MPLPDISKLTPLDVERVTELREQAPQDSSLFVRLYALFQDEGPVLIKDIVENLQAEDRSALHDAVHKVKGSSAAMGASRIYALASGAVEVRRSDEDLAELRELPALLEIEYARYCADAKRFLD